MARSIVDRIAGSREPTVASGQRLACVASVMLLGAVFAPIVQNWRPAPRDGFPFSYYPMFSARRGAKTRVTYLVGVKADGTRDPLHFRFAGCGGQNQLRRQIRRMANEGRSGDLCERVAARLAEERPALHRNLTAVELVTGTYVLDDYFGGRSRLPHREKVHASVPLPAASCPAPSHQAPHRAALKEAT